MINKFILCLGLCIPLSVSAQSKEKNANLIMFVAEVESFFHNARNLNESTELSDAEREIEVLQLQRAGRRIAKLYFAELTGDLKPRMDDYLSRALGANNDLEEYQVLVGNSFVNVAHGLDTNDLNRRSRIRMMSTVGGTLLGLAGGGALVYFKSEWFGTGIQAVAKMGAVVGLSGAVGFGVGYGGGYAATSFVIKTDPAVVNARDFIERYPGGSDFLEELLPVGDEDLIDALGSIEEVANAQ